LFLPERSRTIINTFSGYFERMTLKKTWLFEKVYG